MRDNLLFYGVMECPRQTSPFMAATKDAESYAGEEDCTSKVLQFCNSVLNIQDTKANIRIDRSHRIGKYKSDKIRPIVVKFLDSDSKNIVKHSLKKANLKGTDFNVSEQYPQEIRDRRKELIPVMIQARKDGKKAVLVRDKLYINNALYTLSNK